MLEMDETETCLTQLERIKELRSMGVGDVVRSSEIRLAQFDAAASGDNLSDSIATLEAQINTNANSGKALAWTATLVTERLRHTSEALVAIKRVESIIQLYLG
jgi:hypothetical protein